MNWDRQLFGENSGDDHHQARGGERSTSIDSLVELVTEGVRLLTEWRCMSSLVYFTVSGTTTGKLHGSTHVFRKLSVGFLRLRARAFKD